MMSLTMFFLKRSINIPPSQKLESYETDLAKRCVLACLILSINSIAKCFLQAKYGFVAFSDPEDFLKAWKEMDGEFIDKISR